MCTVAVCSCCVRHQCTAQFCLYFSSTQNLSCSQTSEVQRYKPVQIYSQPNLNLNFNYTQSCNCLLQLARNLLVLLVLSRMKKKIQLLLYLTKKLMHCTSTTQRLLLILRWIKLLLKSLVRPENDGNVLANVLIYTKPLKTKTLK